MPFDTVQESYSLDVKPGSSIMPLVEFLASHKGPSTTVTVKDGAIELELTREETPEEKASRIAVKEKARERNQANYQKAKAELKGKTAAEKLEMVKSFTNPTIGDQ